MQGHIVNFNLTIGSSAQWVFYIHVLDICGSQIMSLLKNT